MEEDSIENYIIAIFVFGFVTYIHFKGFIFWGRAKARKLPRVRFRPVSPGYKKSLQDHFLYYQNLNPENKRRFEIRVQAFIDSNQFIPRSYTHITDEMKALIAGSAVQLTFGFSHLNFAHFSKILIYKDDYYSKITRKYHAGEVNMAGLIVLSWTNFVKGYKNHSDGKNLGLHEMAHALRLENGIRNREYDFIDPVTSSRFNELAVEEMRLIKRGQTLFFRHYASMNLHEFFAVAIENFFERPAEFLDYKPELYDCLTKLLHQDPLKLFPSTDNPAL